MNTQVVKRSQSQQAPFFKEQDKSTKCKGSCVSALIMVVYAITAWARLIWENVFSLQTDRCRDGENPFDPAKIWCACWTRTVDKNVSFSQTSPEQRQQQSSRAVVHKQVQVMVNNIYNTSACDWPWNSCTGNSEQDLWSNVEAALPNSWITLLVLPENVLGELIGCCSHSVNV